MEENKYWKTEEFKNLKSEIKEEQKELAIKIRKEKNRRKTKDYKNDREYWDILYNINSFKREYRANHIAYCIFFNNTPYEKIENPREGNKIEYKSLISIWMKELKI